MLELWGHRCDDQIRLFGEGPSQVLQVVSEYDVEAFDAFEEAGWSTKDADAYHGLAGRVTSRVAGRLLDAAGVGRRTRVLDVATGLG